MAMEAYQFWKKLIVKLMLVISEGRLFKPQKCILCLGINVNINMGIILIPDDKLEEIINICSQWSVKNITTASIPNWVIIIYLQVCAPCKVVCQQNIGNPRATPDNGSVTLSPEFKRDMSLFKAFLPSFVYFECILTSIPSPPSLIYMWTTVELVWAVHGVIKYMPSPST